MDGVSVPNTDDDEGLTDLNYVNHFNCVSNVSTRTKGDASSVIPSNLSYFCGNSCLLSKANSKTYNVKFVDELSKIREVNPWIFDIQLVSTSRAFLLDAQANKVRKKRYKANEKKWSEKLGICDCGKDECGIKTHGMDQPEIGPDGSGSERKLQDIHGNQRIMTVLVTYRSSAKRLASYKDGPFIEPSATKSTASKLKFIRRSLIYVQTALIEDKRMWCVEPNLGLMFLVFGEILENEKVKPGNVNDSSLIDKLPITCNLFKTSSRATCFSAVNLYKSVFAQNDSEYYFLATEKNYDRCDKMTIMLGYILSINICIGESVWNWLNPTELEDRAWGSEGNSPKWIKNGGCYSLSTNAVVSPPLNNMTIDALISSNYKTPGETALTHHEDRAPNGSDTLASKSFLMTPFPLATTVREPLATRDYLIKNALIMANVSDTENDIMLEHSAMKPSVHPGTDSNIIMYNIDLLVAYLTSKGWLEKIGGMVVQTLSSEDLSSPLELQTDENPVLPCKIVFSNNESENFENKNQILETEKKWSLLKNQRHYNWYNLNGRVKGKNEFGHVLIEFKNTTTKHDIGRTIGGEAVKIFDYYRSKNQQSETSLAPNAELQANLNPLKPNAIAAQVTPVKSLSNGPKQTKSERNILKTIGLMKNSPDWHHPKTSETEPFISALNETPMAQDTKAMPNAHSLLGNSNIIDYDLNSISGVSNFSGDPLEAKNQDPLKNPTANNASVWKKKAARLLDDDDGPTSDDGRSDSSLLENGEELLPLFEFTAKYGVKFKLDIPGGVNGKGYKVVDIERVDFEGGSLTKVKVAYMKAWMRFVSESVFEPSNYEELSRNVAATLRKDPLQFDSTAGSVEPDLLVISLVFADQITLLKEIINHEPGEWNPPTHSDYSSFDHSAIFMITSLATSGINFESSKTLTYPAVFSKAFHFIRVFQCLFQMWNKNYNNGSNSLKYKDVLLKLITKRVGHSKLKPTEKFLSRGVLGMSSIPSIFEMVTVWNFISKLDKCDNFNWKNLQNSHIFTDNLFPRIFDVSETVFQHVGVIQHVDSANSVRNRENAIMNFIMNSVNSSGEVFAPDKNTQVLLEVFSTEFGINIVNNYEYAPRADLYAKGSTKMRGIWYERIRSACAMIDSWMIFKQKFPHRMFTDEFVPLLDQHNFFRPVDVVRQRYLIGAEAVKTSLGWNSTTFYYGSSRNSSATATQSKSVGFSRKIERSDFVQTDMDDGSVKSWVVDDKPEMSSTPIRPILRNNVTQIGGNGNRSIPLCPQQGQRDADFDEELERKLLEVALGKKNQGLSDEMIDKSLIEDAALDNYNTQGSSIIKLPDRYVDNPEIIAKAYKHDGIDNNTIFTADNPLDYRSSNIILRRRLIAVDHPDISKWIDKSKVMSDLRSDLRSFQHKGGENSVPWEYLLVKEIIPRIVSVASLHNLSFTNAFCYSSTWIMFFLMTLKNDRTIYGTPDGAISKSFLHNYVEGIDFEFKSIQDCVTKVSKRLKWTKEATLDWAEDQMDKLRQLSDEAPLDFVQRVVAIIHTYIGIGLPFQLVELKVGPRLKNKWIDKILAALRCQTEREMMFLRIIHAEHNSLSRVNLPGNTFATPSLRSVINKLSDIFQSPEHYVRRQLCFERNISEEDIQPEHLNVAFHNAHHGISKEVNCTRSEDQYDKVVYALYTVFHVERPNARIGNASIGAIECYFCSQQGHPCKDCPLLIQWLVKAPDDFQRLRKIRRNEEVKSDICRFHAKNDNQVHKLLSCPILSKIDNEKFDKILLTLAIINAKNATAPKINEFRLNERGRIKSTNPRNYSSQPYRKNNSNHGAPNSGQRSFNNSGNGNYNGNGRQNQVRFSNAPSQSQNSSRNTYYRNLNQSNQSRVHHTEENPVENRDEDESEVQEEEIRSNEEDVICEEYPNDVTFTEFASEHLECENYEIFMVTSNGTIHDTNLNFSSFDSPLIREKVTSDLFGEHLTKDEINSIQNPSISHKPLIFGILAGREDARVIILLDSGAWAPPIIIAPALRRLFGNVKIYPTSERINGIGGQGRISGYCYLTLEIPTASGLKIKLPKTKFLVLETESRYQRFEVILNLSQSNPHGLDFPLISGMKFSYYSETLEIELNHQMGIWYKVRCVPSNSRILNYEAAVVRSENYVTLPIRASKDCSIKPGKHENIVFNLSPRMAKMINSKATNTFDVEPKLANNFRAASVDVDKANGRITIKMENPNESQALGVIKSKDKIGVLHLRNEPPNREKGDVIDTAEDMRALFSENDKVDTTPNEVVDEESSRVMVNDTRHDDQCYRLINENTRSRSMEELHELYEWQMSHLYGRTKDAKPGDLRLPTSEDHKKITIPSTDPTRPNQSFLTGSHNNDEIIEKVKSFYSKFPSLFDDRTLGTVVEVVDADGTILHPVDPKIKPGMEEEIARMRNSRREFTIDSIQASMESIDSYIENDVVEGVNDPPAMMSDFHLINAKAKPNPVGVMETRRRFISNLRKQNRVFETLKTPSNSRFLVISILSHCNLITIVDLASAYFCLLIRECKRRYFGLALPSRIGGPLHYRMKRLPMGYKNSSCHLAAIVHRLLTGKLNKGIEAHVYVDDLIIVSSTTKMDPLDYLDGVERILETLDKSGFKLSPTKCVFIAKSAEFLGNLHCFDEKDKMVVRRPSSEHQKLIRAWKLPSDSVSLSYIRQLLGSLGFHMDKLPMFSLRTWYMRQRLNAAAKAKKKEMMVDEKLKLAFEDLKSAAASCYCYNLPNASDYKAEDLVIHTFLDASYLASGGVLSYELVNDPDRKGKLFVVSFCSRTFPIEMAQNSSSDIIEFTAFCNLVQSFYPVFFGKFKVRIWTDSKNLVSLVNRVNKADLSKGSLSIMLKISHIMAEFTAEVVVAHISGDRNIADAFSRIVYSGPGPDPRRPALEKFTFSSPKLDKAKFGSISQFPFMPKPKEIAPTAIESSTKHDDGLSGDQQVKTPNEINMLMSQFESNDSIENEIQYLASTEFTGSEAEIFAVKSILSKSLNNLDEAKTDTRSQLDESITSDILLFHKESGHKKAHLLKAKYEAERNNGKTLPLSLFKLAVSRCATCMALPEMFKKPTFRFYNLLGYLPMALISMDSGQYLKTSPSGFDSFLVFTDVFSLFSLAYPIKTNSSREYLRCLRLFIQHFGCPFSLKLDNHQSYKSDFEKFCNNRKIRIIKTTPTIHSGNSRVESRINRVKKFLAANLAEYDEKSSYHNPYGSKSKSGDWALLLPEVFVFSNSVQKSFKVDDEEEIASPNELFLSRVARSSHIAPQTQKAFSNLPVRIRYDLVFKSLVYQSVENHQPARQPAFKSGDLVVRRNPTNVRSRRAYRIDEIYRVISIDGAHVVMKELLASDDPRLKIICHASQIHGITEDQMADWSKSKFDFTRLERSFRRQKI